MGQISSYASEAKLWLNMAYRPVGRGGAMGAPAPPTPPQTAEVHYFVKKINSKIKNNSVDLFAKMHPRRLELGTLLKDRDDQQPAEWTIRIYNFISIFVIFK